ncbi:MAG TPA: NAD(P)H-dependent glycerol-3-phosphate dehydrogenase [Patescibacteria group bacterium]|nr:NAD(P)H-dependent glycerol-3-phosphate dehydrogenase [Patescibacteria group bacterium]
MNISVLGCGRWGTFLAWYACRLGHRTMLWGRESSLSLSELETRRANEYLTLPRQLELSRSLPTALEFAEVLVIAVSAQQLRTLARQLALQAAVQRPLYVLCMKGLEAGSGKRLTEVFREETGLADTVGVWVGPGHVQDYLREVPNCMVMDAANPDTVRQLVTCFNSPLIRFYYGQDLVGNEVGAAAKNVMGIAAGMLDGLDYGSLKGALMARGAREVARLVQAMGGRELTAYGLSHLGDYEATLFSAHSNNRRFGEAYVRGVPFQKLAEGVATLEALRQLSARYRVELPICEAMQVILSSGQAPREVLLELFLRPVKYEFDGE